MLDLSNKANYVTSVIPNGKIMIKVRCISLNFEIAEWLETNREIMRKIFYDITNKSKNKEDIYKFLTGFEE